MLKFRYIWLFEGNSSEGNSSKLPQFKNIRLNRKNSGQKTKLKSPEISARDPIDMIKLGEFH